MSVLKLFGLIVMSLVMASSHWPGLAPKMRGRIGYTLSTDVAQLEIDSVFFRRHSPMDGALSVELIATQQPDHQHERQVLAKHSLPPASRRIDTIPKTLVLHAPMQPPTKGTYHLHLRLFPTHMPDNTLDVVTFPHRRRFDQQAEEY